MGYAWLNIGSIALGIASWIFPLLAILYFKRKNEVRGTAMLYCGLVSAILSLLFVITYRKHLIRIEDWSALMDTNSGFQFASSVMSSLAIALGGVALRAKGKSMDKK